MDIVEVEISPRDPTMIEFSWHTPDQRSENLSAYRIVILESDGLTYTEDVGHGFDLGIECDGSDATIFGQRYCDVPIRDLRAAPYNLVEGTLIKAKAQGFNDIGWNIGWGDLSEPNTVGAVVEIEPHKMTALRRGLGTRTDRIHVEWDTLTSDGGIDILSYHLQYDLASAGSSWVSIFGEPSNESTLLEYTKVH